MLYMGSQRKRSFRPVTNKMRETRSGRHRGRHATCPQAWPEAQAH